ncbi:hypothetical protein [Neobacillus endophyticus]|nr:hypothetical protein [Neobacillus endophyticus]
MKYIAGYVMWTKASSAFMVGINLNTDERYIELFLGVFALEIGY